MAQAQGVKGVLAYQEESSFGVVPSSPALKLAYFMSESIQENINLVTSQVLRDSRNPTMPSRGNRDVSGSIQTELTPEMGTLIKAALGTSTPSGGGPYTHVIKTGTTQPSLTIQKGYTDLPYYMLYPGCKVGKMTVNIKPEGFQEVGFDFMGLYEMYPLKYDGQSGNFTAGLIVTGGTSGAKGTIVQDLDGGTSGILLLKNVTGTFANNEAITDSSTGAAVVDGVLGDSSIDGTYTDNGHTPFDGLSAVSLKEGGVAVVNVASCELSIENNLDGGQYVVGGGGVRQSVPSGKIRVSGKLSALFDSTRLLSKANAFEETSLEIVFQHGTGAGTDGNEKLTILIEELKYAKHSPPISGPNGIVQEAEFEAYYDNGAAASCIQITLINAEATI